MCLVNRAVLLIHILFFCVLLFPMQVSAQSIVKDNVRCLYGVMGNDGRWMLEPQFDHATPFIHGFSLVSKGEQYGVVSSNAKIVIPLIYERLEFFRLGMTWIPEWMEDAPYEAGDALPGIFRCFTENGVGIIDTGGRMRVEPVYEEISYFRNDLACISQSGKYGLVNDRGKIILPAEYTFCPEHAYSNVFSVRKDYKMGLANRTGLLVQPDFDDVKVKDSVSFIVLKDGKWGVIADNSKEVLPFAFEKLEYFGAEKLIYKKQNKWGIASRTTGRQEPMQYDSIGRLSDKAAAVVKNGKYGIIDTNGRELEPPIYDTLLNGIYAVLIRGRKVVCYNLQGYPRREYPSHGKDKVMIIGGNRGKYSQGLCDTLGNLLLGLNYEISYVGDGLFFCLDEKGASVAYNSSGERLKNFSGYATVSEFIANYAYVIAKNGKAGVCDSLGNVVIPAKFYGVSYYDLSLGLAWVLPRKPPVNAGALDSNDVNWCAARYALVNTGGRYITPVIFEKPSEFVFGQAVTKKDGYEGVIDANGRTVIPFQYDEVVPLENGIYKIRKDTAWGLANAKGKILSPPLYPVMFDLKNGYMRVQGETKEGLLDTIGRLVVPYSVNSWTFSPLKIDSLYFPELYNQGFYYDAMRPIGNVAITYSTTISDKRMERVVSNFALAEAYRLSLDNSDGSDEDYWGECVYSLFSEGSHSRMNFVPMGYYSIGHELVITAVTATTFSIIHKRTEADRYGGYDTYAYQTYMVNGTALNKLVLDSLFDETEAYRQVLNKMLLEKARYLEMDCPNPDEFIDTLENSFAITEEGIVFFIPNTGEAIKLGFDSIKTIIKKHGPLSRYL